jgi:hypothetical protein
MSFTIPNTSGSIEDPTGVFPQAQIDKVDVDILAAGAGGRSGVSSGCAVTAQGSPNMTVAVASGTVVVAGTEVAVTSGNVTVGAAHASLNRFDLITVNNSGTKACTAGTAASSPVFPAIPANSVVLAAIYIPDADTAINSNQIIDKRITVPTPASDSGWTTVSKASDQSRTTNTVLADDNTLVFNVGSSTVYRFRGYIWAYSATTTPDLKWGFNGPASPTGFVYRYATGGEVSALTEVAPALTYDAGHNLNIATGSAEGAAIRFEGLLSNGANAGTLAFRWAQNTSNGTAITVRAGSYIEYSVA